MRIRAYILAGGKSSRMGRDKAMLELEGLTLLARAVAMLRGAAGFRVACLVGQECVITIVGERRELEGADRSLVDRYAGCGPLGGIEAALNDLEEGRVADWAFFIPVDMPLLRSELVEGLLEGWGAAIEADPTIRVCMTVVDGRPQPLVSLVHRTVLQEVRSALGRGMFKVGPVLQSAGVHRTSLGNDASMEGPAERSDDGVATREMDVGQADLEPRFERKIGAESASQSGDRGVTTRAQFTNVNTEPDLMEVATLLKRSGSIL